MTDRMRIGELAERAGVTTRTIRYYESLGLLGPSEREGTGFRYYTDEALARLRKIDFLKNLDFSLEEIGSVIDLYFSEPSGLQGKQKILEILQGHLQETEGKIGSLEQFRAELKAKIASMQEVVERARSL